MYYKHKAYIHASDIIIPIPMEDKRLIARGYNQAQLIAKMISMMSGLTIDETLLKKHKVEHSQIELGRVDRYKNLANAFEFIGDKNLIQKKDILLIDDVMTTGATIDTVARLLKKNGAKKVHSLTFARTY